MSDDGWLIAIILAIAFIVPSTMRLGVAAHQYYGSPLAITRSTPRVCQEGRCHDCERQAGGWLCDWSKAEAP